MINRKLVKLLSFRYVILALLFIILAGGLVLLPKFEKQEGISPEQLLSNIISPERYITTDELADRIINQDPSLLLIDLRDEETFKKYSLPNAINIPFKNLFNENSAAFLNQDAYDVVFLSNDNFEADQAWMLCNRLEYINSHVLKGGINTWFKTIINPPYPEEHMPSEAFELYATRKAASMYFGVAYPDQVKTNAPKQSRSTPKRVITVKKKKKAPEGGC